MVKLTISKQMLNNIPDHASQGSLQKKNKKCGFFPHWGGGGQPQIHTFLKVWIFKGGWGVLGPISTLFCPILFFFKNFVLFHPVFVGWKAIFRGKYETIFFPPKCVSPLQGGGAVREGWNPHFFFLKASQTLIGYCVIQLTCIQITCCHERFLAVFLWLLIAMMSKRDRERQRTH